MVHDTVLTFSDGKLSLPKEVQEEMHLKEGSRLRLVSVSPDELRLQHSDLRAEQGDSGFGHGALRAEPKEKPAAVDGREPIWLGNRWWIPNDSWKTMRGMLSGHPDHDTSAVRHAERVWELEHGERKFGPFPKR